MNYPMLRSTAKNDSGRRATKCRIASEAERFATSTKRRWARLGRSDFPQRPGRVFARERLVVGQCGCKCRHRGRGPVVPEDDGRVALQAPELGALDRRSLERGAELRLRHHVGAPARRHQPPRQACAPRRYLCMTLQTAAATLGCTDTGAICVSSCVPFGSNQSPGWQSPGRFGRSP